MKRFTNKMKYLKLKDFGHFFLFLFALIQARVFKFKRGDFWLICEDKNEARDNGYWLFRYVCEKHPEQDIVYAINPESPDYNKVKLIGQVVAYGGFRHWIYYLAASVNISSQKGGKPNAAVCYLLEVYGVLKNKRVFLQHGITKDDADWLYYKNTKMRLFVCGARPEYDFVKERFGYPDKNVAYLGFPRYDALHNAKMKRNRVLIMPTWRKWIADEDRHTIKLEGSKSFEDTEYYHAWIEFLTDRRLKNIVTENKLELIFFPHRNTQKYLTSFSLLDTPAVIADWKVWDIQELLKTSALMITDYSSVFFDFIYMKKPVIFYQFDYKRFRENQYAEGYFDYRNNPFGRSCDSLEKLYDELDVQIMRGFKIDKFFEDGHRNYFNIYDQNNCERNFETIKNLTT
ncbi:CDP-glycerol glycerophosphotransferase family protein [Eubacterium aggregans]|uniref:CDP-glycerol glycerophosphotransferase family protein n=1 Tax=Eubacterium aggregans TaxID=81409 RepID=UPI003F374184